MRIAESAPVSVAETKALFSDLCDLPVLVLAVSGGPDSTALMVLAARWRAARGKGPKLVAVTIDHGLRRGARREAAAVAKLARKLKVAHRILRWNGAKPKTGLQQAAREARYRLLAKAARAAGAAYVLSAHTRDDQAETVLIRMSRGSGVAGLAAMARETAVPGVPGMRLVRPLLGIPKSRLVATLKAAKIAFADDPSNRDPRFTRARLRGLMPALAQEGLDAARLALLAQRAGRANAAIEAAVARATRELRVDMSGGAATFEVRRFAELPAEVGLRLLGRALDQAGDEGPVELAKLEALKSALDAAIAAGGAFRRTLAGAIVALAGPVIAVERAPARRSGKVTTRRAVSARRRKTR